MISNMTINEYFAVFNGLIFYSILKQILGKKFPPILEKAITFCELEKIVLRKIFHEVQLGVTLTIFID